MKQIKFIVEKSSTGYAAYAENFEKYPVTTTADTIEELKVNLADALNTWLEFKKLAPAEPGQIAIKIDLPQFFEYYKELNAKAIGKRAGISQTLLSDYVNGRKQPSDKQTKRILSGIQALGKELASLDFA